MIGPAEWLRSVAAFKRWFADKSRTIAAVDIVWRAPLPNSNTIELVVSRIVFTDGVTSLYFLPWDSLTRNEAVATPEFSAWLVDSIAGRVSMPVQLTWQRIDAVDLSPAATGPGRLLGVEQSNTSIRIGDDLLVKVNRRLTSGPSPEAELSAVIARAADPSFAAPTHGLLLLSGVAEEPACLAVCSRFVANVGDAWSYLTGLMRDPADADGAIGSEIDAIARVTAAMHIGLTSDPWRREVAPELITRADLEAWESAAIVALDSLLKELEKRESTLPAESRSLARLLPDARPMLESQLRGYQSLIGTHRIRIHGDYHLGQLLRKPEGGYVVVDFDGEPNRSLAERRDKYSALRDVAGMLRSFAYARGTVQQSVGQVGHVAEWKSWERAARDRCLSVYRSALGVPAVPLIPDSTDDIRQAIAAFELEKAIYECGYELSNRPGWLWLPLSRLVSSG